MSIGQRATVGNGEEKLGKYMDLNTLDHPSTAAIEVEFRGKP